MFAPRSTTSTLTSTPASLPLGRFFQTNHRPIVSPATERCQTRLGSWSRSFRRPDFYFHGTSFPLVFFVGPSTTALLILSRSICRKHTDTLPSRLHHTLLVSLPLHFLDVAWKARDMDTLVVICRIQIIAMLNLEKLRWGSHTESELCEGSSIKSGCFRSLAFAISVSNLQRVKFPSNNLFSPRPRAGVVFSLLSFLLLFGHRVSFL